MCGICIRVCEHVCMSLSLCTYMWCVPCTNVCMSKHLWTQNTHVHICMRACLYIWGVGVVCYTHACYKREEHLCKCSGPLSYGCPSSHPVNSNKSTLSHIKFRVINKNSGRSSLVTSKGKKKPKTPTRKPPHSPTFSMDLINRLPSSTWVWVYFPEWLWLMYFSSLFSNKHAHYVMGQWTRITAGTRDSESFRHHCRCKTTHARTSGR